MKLKLLLLILLVGGITALAQQRTAIDLRQRYGPPVREAYLVRPDILLTVEYDANGQLTESVLEPRYTLKDRMEGPTANRSATMSSDVVEEILEEIVPTSERGQSINQLSFNAGCSGILISTYGKVEITKAFTCCPTPRESGLLTVRIRWKINNNMPVKVLPDVSDEP